MPPYLVLLYISIGFSAGITTGLFGLGGGIVLLPALIMLSTLVSQATIPFPTYYFASALALAVMVISTGVATLLHWRKSNIDKYWLFKIIPSVFLGGILGRLYSNNLSSVTMLILFCLSLCWALYGLWFKSYIVAHKESIPNDSVIFGIIIVLSALSSALGVGGGLFLVPLLLYLGLQHKQSVATATTCSFILAFASTFYLMMTEYRWLNHQMIVIILMGIGSSIGALLGTKLLNYLPLKHFKVLFTIILLLITLQMGLQLLS